MHRHRTKTHLGLYLENLPLVIIQHLLLEAIVTDRLHAHQTQNLDQRILLGDAVLYVCVHLERKTQWSSYL